MVRPGYRSRVRDGFVLFPPGWEEYGAAVANGQYTALGEIWTGPTAGEPEWVYDGHTEKRNLGTRLWPSVEGGGAMRFQQIGGGIAQTAGEQQVTEHSYRVSFPRPVTVGEVGGYVKVVDSSDPAAAGAVWKIVDVQKGSLRWQRDLVVTDNLG